MAVFEAAEAAAPPPPKLNVDVLAAGSDPKVGLGWEAPPKVGLGWEAPPKVNVLSVAGLVAVALGVLPEVEPNLKTSFPEEEAPPNEKLLEGFAAELPVFELFVSVFPN